MPRKFSGVFNRQNEGMNERPPRLLPFMRLHSSRTNGGPLPMEANMPKSSDERERAEERFRKVAEAHRVGDAARDEYAAQARAVDQKISRLKALRLARP